VEIIEINLVKLDSEFRLTGKMLKKFTNTLMVNNVTYIILNGDTEPTKRTVIIKVEKFVKEILSISRGISQSEVVH
jgi:hypothetical protein